MSEKFAEAMKSFPTSESFATSKYYRGGFEGKMTRREAALILGVSPTAPKGKVSSNMTHTYFHLLKGQIATYFCFVNSGERRSQTNYVIKSSRSRWFTVFSSKNK